MKQCGIWWFLLLLVTMLSLWSQSGLAVEKSMRGPWGVTAGETVGRGDQPIQSAVSLQAGFFRGLLSFFQEVISPVDGDRCPSYPTCSAYSMEAYGKHGALLGTLMTVDRLIHEASEGDFAPTIEIYGVKRIYDPVSANEFWRRADEKKENEFLSIR
jgi:putative component of membrane protein insertase Oxa1/YidC/SpoIIIJ protein YidD